MQHGGYAAPTIAAAQTGPSPIVQQLAHQSQPHMMPQTGPYPGGAPLRKKSNAGLIIAVLAILAVGGGIAAFLVLGAKETPKPNDDKGSNAVALGSGSGSDKTTTPPPHDNGSAGSGSAVTAKIDVGSANSGSAVVPDKGSDKGSGMLPPAAPVEVVIETSPSRAQIFGLDKKLIGSNGFIAKVQPGETLHYVVKLKGFHDKDLVIDGTKSLVQVDLVATGGTGPHTNPIYPTNPTNPPPPHVDCSRTMVDAHNAACQKQYCATHPTEPACSIVD
jgi:hypothetical protein